MARRFLTGLVSAMCLAVAAQTWIASPAEALSDQWTSVGSGSTNNISGLAPAASGWVVVRDNKKAGQNRVALVSDSAVVTALTWPGTLPVDLEAIDQVPGSDGTYAALTSTGQGWILSIQGTALTVLRQFTLPTATSGVEAFALTVSAGVTVAVWSTRGSSSAAAKVSTAAFDPSTGAFGPISTGKIRVPYPTVSARQVADLKVVGTRLLISSTSDPGATGPFASAVYDVGTVAVAAGRPALHLQTPVELGRYSGHKVEGIACSGGVGALGSDDEKAGGAIRTDSFCPA
jgi:hypothetical protein